MTRNQLAVEMGKQMVKATLSFTIYNLSLVGKACFLKTNVQTMDLLGGGKNDDNSIGIYKSNDTAL